MAFIFWQPSDSSPPLFRPPLSELFSSGVETCLFRQNPSEAFHQKEKASEGFCFKGVSTPEKRRFEESGLASVTERPTGVKARKLRVLAQPLPSPAFHYFKGRVCFRDRASLRAMARKMRLLAHPSLFPALHQKKTYNSFPQKDAPAESSPLGLVICAAHQAQE